mgnify:CR=1 FL=1
MCLRSRKYRLRVNIAQADIYAGRAKVDIRADPVRKIIDQLYVEVVASWCGQL